MAPPAASARALALGLAVLGFIIAPLVGPALADDPAPWPLRIACYPTEYQHMAMEWSASKGRCWMHSGHHTYFLNGTYTLAGATGFLDSVEQQMSPPTEYTTPPFDSPVVIEVSLDGQTWSTLTEAVYDVVNLPGEGPVLETRQRLAFTLPSYAEPFRYLRVHEPRSAFQGLSGFLDISRIDLLLHPAAAPPAGAFQAGSFAFSCDAGDILEDFFPTHPCTFGGVNRYDSPSLFHTYPLGPGANVTRIAGTVQLAPWRTDDFFIPIGNVQQAAGTQAYIEVSADGEAWTTLARVSVPTWALPASFDLVLAAPTNATFVRVHGDYHPFFDDYVAEPALHHLEAMLVASAIEVDGNLPG